MANSPEKSLNPRLTSRTVTVTLTASLQLLSASVNGGTVTIYPAGGSVHRIQPVAIRSSMGGGYHPESELCTHHVKAVFANVTGCSTFMPLHRAQHGIGCDCGANGKDGAVVGTAMAIAIAKYYKCWC